MPIITGGVINGGSLPDPITQSINAVVPDGDVIINAQNSTSGIVVDTTGETTVLVNENAANGLAVDAFGAFAGALLSLNSSGNKLAVLADGTTTIGTPTSGLGFFGAGAVSQPAVPTTLGDVIAALQALGLVAT